MYLQTPSRLTIHMYFRKISKAHETLPTKSDSILYSTIYMYFKKYCIDTKKKMKRPNIIYT